MKTIETSFIKTICLLEIVLKRFLTDSVLEKRIFKIRIVKTIKELKSINIYIKFSTNFIDLSCNKTDFRTWRDKYLRPIHDSILHELSDIEFADSVFVVTKRAINRLHNIEFNSIEFAKEMEKVETKIENSIETLTTINNELKEKMSHRFAVYERTPEPNLINNDS